jgi:hypothetical protein
LRDIWSGVPGAVLRIALKQLFFGERVSGEWLFGVFVERGAVGDVGHRGQFGVFECGFGGSLPFCG